MKFLLATLYIINITNSSAQIIPLENIKKSSTSISLDSTLKHDGFYYTFYTNDTIWKIHEISCSKNKWEKDRSSFKTYAEFKTYYYYKPILNDSILLKYSIKESEMNMINQNITVQIILKGNKVFGMFQKQLVKNGFHKVLVGGNKMNRTIIYKKDDLNRILIFKQIDYNYKPTIVKYVFTLE